MTSHFRLALAGLAIAGLAILVLPQSAAPSPADDLVLYPEELPRLLHTRCPRLSLSCQALPTPRGLLAPHLDSALSRITILSCTTFPLTSKFGSFRFTPDTAFSHCVGGDSAAVLEFGIGDQGTVVSVSHIWATGTGISDYHALVTSFTGRFGPGRLCPQNDAMSFTDNLRWEHVGYNEGVYLVDSARAAYDILLGPIDCHVG